MKTRFLPALLCLVLFLCLLSGHASAAESTAQDISGVELITTISGFPDENVLFDGELLSGAVTPDDASITLESPTGIGSVYFLFEAPYGAYTITNNDTGKSILAGENGFYHEFVDLTAAFGIAPTSVTVDFSNGPVMLNELYVYTDGEVPDSVQKWKAPADGRADLVLFSTHGDDEQLFFAGVLPYYAAELGYQVQVVYFTDHRELQPHRVHEMLNGLWTVGVTNYPVFGSHPDFYLQHDMLGTYAEFKKLGYSRNDMMAFVVENLRRFKPMVAIGHDIKGEYGHGMHMVYTDLLMDAITIANNASYFPESAEKYGLWDTPKMYLHLYRKYPIIMDWDQPLSSFDGMTAFEVTQQLGYPCHVSQYQGFEWYHSHYKTAKDVPDYNPCYYGLYRSLVGEDVQKNDFFENLTTYTELEKTIETGHTATAGEPIRQEDETAYLQAEAVRIIEEQRQVAEAASRRATAIRLLILVLTLGAFLAITLLVHKKMDANRREKIF